MKLLRKTKIVSGENNCGFKTERPKKVKNKPKVMLIDNLINKYLSKIFNFHKKQHGHQFLQVSDCHVDARKKKLMNL